MKKLSHSHRHHYHISFLQLTLALVFFWFGFLKFFGASPVYLLIMENYGTLALSGVGTVLAFIEIVVGMGLLMPKFAPTAAYVGVLHLLIVTFIVLITPQAFIDGFPYLSLSGEFVVKNFVLIAGLLLVANHNRQQNIALPAAL